MNEAKAYRNDLHFLSLRGRSPRLARVTQREVGHTPSNPERIKFYYFGIVPKQRAVVVFS